MYPYEEALLGYFKLTVYIPFASENQLREGKNCGSRFHMNAAHHSGEDMAMVMVS